jgi:putative SOS response-associated peptidase YedK
MEHYLTDPDCQAVGGAAFGGDSSTSPVHGFAKGSNCLIAPSPSTFTIIAGTAHAVMRELHDRIPVILEPADWPTWLGEAEDDQPANSSSVSSRNLLLLELLDSVPLIGFNLAR